MATPIGVPPAGGSGYLAAWGGNVSGSATVPDALRTTRVRAVAAGSYHNLALTTRDTVVAWGMDDAGQTTVPSSLAGKTVVAIAAGGEHNLALTDAGLVVGWGLDNTGAATVPHAVRTKRVTAIAAGLEHSLALTADGVVLAWGADTDGQSTVPAALSGVRVTAIAAGSTHSLAVTSAGKVVAWGSDRFGESTIPSALADEVVTAVAAGDGDSMALTDDGRVVAWGYSDDGQTSPPPFTGATAIAAGAYSCYALTDEGFVGWGYNANGSTVNLSGLPVLAVAGGTTHTLVITAPGSPATATAVSAVSGGSQTVAAGSTFADPLVAEVTDADDNPVADVPVQFTLSSSTATFQGGSTTVTADTGANGRATSPPVHAGANPGTLTAAAAVANVSTPASFPLTVTAAPAAPSADLDAAMIVTTRAKVHQHRHVKVIVHNAGGSTATKVRTTFVVPSGWRITDLGGGDRVDTHTVVFTEKSLAKAASTTARLVVRTGSHLGLAHLKARTTSSTADPDTTNNSVSAPVRLVSGHNSKEQR